MKKDKWSQVVLSGQMISPVMHGARRARVKGGKGQKGKRENGEEESVQSVQTYLCCSPCSPCLRGEIFSFLFLILGGSRTTPTESVQSVKSVVAICLWFLIHGFFFLVLGAPPCAPTESVIICVNLRITGL